MTERVRAREDLEAAKVTAESQRARLHELLMQTPAIVAVLRGPSYVYELVNPAYKQLIGGREFIGLPMREAMPELVGQGFFELLDGVYATGNPVAGTEVLVHFDRTGTGKMSSICKGSTRPETARGSSRSPGTSSRTRSSSRPEAGASRSGCPPPIRSSRSR